MMRQGMVHGSRLSYLLNLEVDGEERKLQVLVGAREWYPWRPHFAGVGPRDCALLDKSCTPFSSECSWHNVLGGRLGLKGNESFFVDSVL